MERLLLLWDELDDLARVLARLTAAQAAALIVPVAAAVSFLATGLLGLTGPVHLLLAGAPGYPWIP